MRFSLLMAVLSFAALVASATPAQAQGEADPTRREARAYFEAGVAAAEAERWPDALRAFQGAFRLSGAPVARLNVAFALSALGRSIEVREVCRELLEEGRLDAARRTQVDRMLSEAESRITQVSLVGAEPGATIALDGRPVSAEAHPIEVDPGHHVISVSASGYTTFHWEGALEPGARQTVPVELVPELLPSVIETGRAPRSAPLAPVHAPPPLGETSVFEEPSFWGISGAILVIGAALAVGLSLGLAGPELEPLSSRRYSL